MSIKAATPLERARLALGGTLDHVAEVVGLTGAGVGKWRKAGRLPRTELTGETDYAGMIAKATEGEVSRRALIEWTRDGWRRNAASPGPAA